MHHNPASPHTPIASRVTIAGDFVAVQVAYNGCGFFDVAGGRVHTDRVIYKQLEVLTLQADIDRRSFLANSSQERNSSLEL